MTGMDMDWWHRPWPTGVLIVGWLMLILGAVSTYTGKTYIRGVTDKAKDPVSYWLILAMQYVFGLFFIWWWSRGLPQLFPN
jgi:hypothetical protein